MDATAVLYALTTLAQTCAALAALVGAVGLYRIQALRDQQMAVYDDIYSLLGRPIITPATAIAEARKRSEANALIREVLQRYDNFAPIIRQSRWRFAVFEAWNLLVILFSLVGFAFIPCLVQQWWMPPALLIAALGTVGVTGYGVLAWVK